MAAAPVLTSGTSQVKQELIVTRLARRLGLRQETVWTRLGELKAERRKKEIQQAMRAGGAPAVQASAARTTKPAGDPSAKADPKYTCERQLLELLLADPALVPRAADAIAPEELTHTGLRRMLGELYAVQAAGGVPDIDALRERMPDRADLFDAALKLQYVGQHMQDRDQWLDRVLKRFTELKVEAEKRAVAERLKTAGDDEAVELLRRLQRRGDPGADDKVA
jgi:DNA primase